MCCSDINSEKHLCISALYKEAAQIGNRSATKSWQRACSNCLIFNLISKPFGPYLLLPCCSRLGDKQSIVGSVLPQHSLTIDKLIFWQRWKTLVFIFCLIVFWSFIRVGCSLSSTLSCIVDQGRTFLLLYFFCNSAVFLL